MRIRGIVCGPIDQLVSVPLGHRTRLHVRIATEQVHGIEMVAIAKCKRCVDIAKSWHNDTLEKAATKFKKKDYQEKWKTAEHNYDAKLKGTPTQFSTVANVKTGRLVYFNMSASYWFITSKERSPSMGPWAIAQIGYRNVAPTATN